MIRIPSRRWRWVLRAVLGIQLDIRRENRRSASHRRLIRGVAKWQEWQKQQSLADARADWNLPPYVLAFHERAWFVTVMHWIQEAFGYEIGALSDDDLDSLFSIVRAFHYGQDVPIDRAAPLGFAHFVTRCYSAEDFCLPQSLIEEWTATPMPQGFEFITFDTDE